MKSIILRKAAVFSICITTLILPLSATARGGGSDRISDNFNQSAQSGASFADVPPDAWYASDVSEAYNCCLMNGISETEFDPDGNISVAVGIVMAARLSSIYSTGKDVVRSGEPWYSAHVKYALDNDIISALPKDYDTNVTRGQFMEMLARALPDEAYEEINPIKENSIPDVPSSHELHDEIYKLYRAGIVAGKDDVHRALPDEVMTRAEAAPILLRIVVPSRRQRVTLPENLTIYNDDGQSMTVAAADYGFYESEGWDIYSEVTVFAPDGRTSVIPKKEKKAWLEVGWYDHPVITIYYPDGSASVVSASEKDHWLEAGWYDYPIATIYAADERSLVVPIDTKDEWLEVGWYDYPVTTIYADDGRTNVIPLSEKDEWLAVGWRSSSFIPMPPVLSQKGRTTTDIPVLSIGTGGRSISSGKDYTPCIVNTFNVESEIGLINGTGGIRVRGNASRSANPPPYRIKFDTKQNLLGLNDGAKAKSWVLLNYPDGAVESIKNDIAFRMGRMLMKPDGIYCSDARLVHVYINEGFCGTYLLCEQNQANKHRVDVNEPENGYTGTDVGYLVEIDNYAEAPYFTMNYENAYVSDIYGKSRRFRSAAYSIKSDVYSREQEDFIAKYVRGVFQIMYLACEKNIYMTFDENYDLVYSDFTDAWTTIDAVADVQSLVDMYILYEIMDDNDVGEGSFFMCVDFSADSKHPKLTFTAPWDFNWTCLGNATGRLYASSYCTDSFMSTFGDRSNPWFILLYKQWWFRALVSTKWTMIGGSRGIDSCINEENTILDMYRPDINRKKGSSADAGKYYLNWIHNRSVWLDSLWLKEEN